MSSIKKISHAYAPFPLRAIPLATLMSGLLVGPVSSGLLVRSLNAAEIEEVLVEDSQRDTYRLEKSSLSKFTQDLADTPQSVTTITRDLLDDRAAMSLTDALRNVPGITLGAGEFSWQGNSPNIRGFSSRNDMFLDGMRDFGSYDRDPFNLESVEVLLGPSSMAFGRGSTGGVINQTSKHAIADPIRSLHLNMGNAATHRAELDVNQPLGNSAAMRVNLLSHEADAPERDAAHIERQGLATSLSLELGDATTFMLDYMMQDSDNTPDYGLPWLAGAPADVQRSTYYGFNSDFVNTQADITSANLEHEFSDQLKLQGLLRYADYKRQTRITEPLLEGVVTPATPLAEVRVKRNVFRGESSERMLQGQLNLIASFQTGNVEHALVSGLEMARESSDPVFGFGLGVPGTTLLNPQSVEFSSQGIAWRLDSNSDADSLAVFALDTVKLTEQWQVLLGARWDSFDIDYNARRFTDAGVAQSSERIQRKDIEASWRAALVYKPVEEGTLYVGIGTSFNPSSEGLSFINSGRNLTISNAYLDPELNRSVELGVKWELLNSALYVDAAVFNITKRNARVPDPANPGFNALAGEQSVNGLSLSMAGSITDSLTLNAAYTWLDSEQAKTSAITVLPGTALTNTPTNSFSLWFSYLPADFWQLGGGVRYVGERLATNSQPVKQVSGYTVIDAMTKYEFSDNLTFKLNLTNLSNEYYFEQLHPWHVIPGPGRAAVFSVNLDY